MIFLIAFWVPTKIELTFEVELLYISLKCSINSQKWCRWMVYIT